MPLWPSVSNSISGGSAPDPPNSMNKSVQACTIGRDILGVHVSVTYVQVTGFENPFLVGWYGHKYVPETARIIPSIYTVYIRRGPPWRPTINKKHTCTALTDQHLVVRGHDDKIVQHRPQDSPAPPASVQGAALAGIYGACSCTPWRMRGSNPSLQRSRAATYAIFVRFFGASPQKISKIVGRCYLHATYRGPHIGPAPYMQLAPVMQG